MAGKFKDSESTYQPFVHVVEGVSRFPAWTYCPKAHVVDGTSNACGALEVFVHFTDSNAHLVLVMALAEGAE